MTKNIELNLIDRKYNLFDKDLELNSNFLSKEVSSSSFLVIGGAGTIGQAVVKEIFSRNPKKIHVVDISENNLVELVRDLRSSYGYIDGEFKTFAIDVGSIEYDLFLENDGSYDYVLNLSALKHVRSEKDPYTLMRMIDVNILNTIKTLKQFINKGCKKYFCVSTDKATNPVNLMGASKRIMEMFLVQYSETINISTARFANVAFSDGSLLFSFQKRIEKRQPIVAPKDVKRYFITSKEAGELCLLSCIFGDTREIFFPKLENLKLISFDKIAKKYIEYLGYNPYLCRSEDEAREIIKDFKDNSFWPCFFSDSDTTGEKDFEEFYNSNQKINLNKFSSIGVIEDDFTNNHKLDLFLDNILYLKNSKSWTRDNIIELFESVIDEFQHLEKGKFLDEKM